MDAGLLFRSVPATALTIHSRQHCLINHLCTRILPSLTPWQHSRSAVSMASPDRMMDTPQMPRVKSTPT